MIVVEEKQFSEKIMAATRMVGDELSEYKGNMLSQGNTTFPWKQDQPHWKCCDLLPWPAGSLLHS